MASIDGNKVLPNMKQTCGTFKAQADYACQLRWGVTAGYAGGTVDAIQPGYNKQYKQNASGDNAKQLFVNLHGIIHVIWGNNASSHGLLQQQAEQ